MRFPSAHFTYVRARLHCTQRRGSFLSVGLVASLVIAVLGAVPTVAVVPVRADPGHTEQGVVASAHIAEVLQDRGLIVVTPQDAMAVLGARSDALTCDSVECTVDLARAFKVAILVRSDLVADGDRLTLAARAYDGVTGAQIAGARATASSSEGFGRAVDGVATHLRAQLLREKPPLVLLGGARVWIPAGVGVALLAAGAALSAVAVESTAQLGTPLKAGEAPLTYAQGQQRAANAQALGTAGATMLGLAGVSLGVAAAMYFSLPVVIVPVPMAGVPGLVIAWNLP